MVKCFIGKIDTFSGFRSSNKIFNSGQILKLIGAIDDKLLEKSTSNMPLKPSWKSKDITPDESKQIFCRYEESLAIEN